MTLTIMSVGSLILGIGLSSIETACGPLKTTAFIVSLDMMYLGCLLFILSQFIFTILSYLGERKD